MLKSPVYNSSPHFHFVYRNRNRNRNPFVENNVEALLLKHPIPNTPRLRGRFASASPSTAVKASVAAPMENPFSAHVVVTVKRHVGRLLLPNLGLKRWLYDVTDYLWGTKTLVFELLSTEMDPSTSA